MGVFPSEVAGIQGHREDGRGPQPVRATLLQGHEHPGGYRRGQRAALTDALEFDTPLGKGDGNRNPFVSGNDLHLNH